MPANLNRPALRALCSAALTLAACTSGEKAAERPDALEKSEQAVAPATSDTAVASAGAAKDSMPPGDTASAAPPTTEPRAGDVAAGGQQTKWPGVVADVSELRRRGNAVNAKVRFSNHGSKTAQPDFSYKDTYLLDADNNKFEVLKDTAGNYLAALRSGYSDRWYDAIDPAASLTVWMRFSAPPPDVKVVSLQIPGVEPFEDLQITE
jgi:hypothetical protein